MTNESKKIKRFEYLEETPWNSDAHFKMVIHYNDGSTEVEYDEENVLRYLIECGFIFVGFVRIHEDLLDDDVYHRGTILGLYVNCNDAFVWACADGQSVCSVAELGEIYELTKTKKVYAGIIWAAHKRKVKPQEAVVNDMKRRGEWDETLDQYESYQERYERLEKEKS